MIQRLLYLLNALEHISVTFDRIRISLMFEDENEPNTIVCKLKFGDIATFVRFLYLENAFSHIHINETVCV